MAWDDHWDQLAREEKLEAVRVHLSDLSNRESNVIGAVLERIAKLERQVQELSREEWVSDSRRRRAARPSR